MPDLTEMLGSAADAVTPSPLPPFSDVERRHRRRRVRRVGSLLGAVVLVTGGIVGLATLSGGHRETTPANPQPCVARTQQNARDTLVAIPSSGVRHVDIAVSSVITVGWLQCGERGDLQLSDDDPKTSLLGAPNSGFRVPTVDVTSARFQAFHVGTVTLTGRGSLGSTGTLEITVGQIKEPMGASDPSPFPGRGVNEDVPQLCLTSDAADNDGRVTRTVSFNTAVLAPAPSATSRFTAADILHRFGMASWAVGIEGHPKAYFGTMTDNNTTPFPKRRALWVVVVCDAPQFAHGAPYVGPAPAAGTSPSPGGRYFGMISVPYDENGHALGESITNYADPELLSGMLFEVPFTRNQQDASAGRQIGLAYRSDDSCSTFDHLDVQEFTNHMVYVQVWLRLTGDHEACTGTRDVHDVTVGLREALQERPLVRGVPPR